VPLEMFVRLHMVVEEIFVVLRTKPVETLAVEELCTVPADLNLVDFLVVEFAVCSSLDQFVECDLSEQPVIKHTKK